MKFVRIPERADHRILAVGAALISCAALAWNLAHDLVLLPNDAIGHINDARRIFDSRTPGILQLDTVWLPLPQLLQAPFLFNDWLWRTGIGGCIPSMIAYIFGAQGIFRLVRPSASRPVAWLAAAIYALNPNLVYMQATPMSEALYLALMIWAVVCFDRFRREVAADSQSAVRALHRCAWLLAAAMLVRYDGWFLAACIFAAAVMVVFRAGAVSAGLKPALVRFAAIVAVTAGVWLAYNHFGYGSTLEFVTGPYSVRGITEKTTMADYPGHASPRVAALYFLKAATVNAGGIGGPFTLLNIAFVALLTAFYFSRRHLPLLLLWTPVVFYILNIAWNSVIIFLPMWPPFSYYNVRYGLQLLPAIAVFAALAGGYLRELLPARYSLAVITLAVAIGYGSILRAGPICLGEARANGAPRQALDVNIAAFLGTLPPSATIMMDCRMKAGAVQRAGIPFRRVLQPGNYYAWRHALTDPAAAADYVVAVAGDEVSEAVRLHPRGLGLIATIDTPGQPVASVYRAMR